MKSNLIGTIAKSQVLNYKHPFRTERNHLYFVEEVRNQIKDLPCNITEELYVTNHKNSDALVIFKTDFYDDENYALSVVIHNSIVPSKGITISTGFCSKAVDSYSIHTSNVVFNQKHSAGKYIVRRAIDSNKIAELLSDVDWFSSFYAHLTHIDMLGYEEIHKYLLMKYKAKNISTAIFNMLLRETALKKMSNIDVINYVNDMFVKKNLNLIHINATQNYNKGLVYGLIPQVEQELNENISF